MVDVFYVFMFSFVFFVLGMNYGERSFIKYLTMKANGNSSKSFKGHNGQWLYVDKE